MEIKKNILIESISNINMHIDIINNNIQGGYENKEGQSSFNQILEELILKKQALQEALDQLQ
jgi:hypothetical protein